jgi:putative DNA primase/helicase
LKACNVAQCITDDVALAADIEKLLVGLSDDQCEKALFKYEEYRNAIPEPLSPDGILRAVQAARRGLEPESRTGTGDPALLSDVPVSGQLDGVPRASSGNSSRMIQRNGATLRIEATPLGGARATVLISRLEPPMRLLLDQGSITSAKVRERLVEKLPVDVRLEAAALLEDLGADVTRLNGSSRLTEPLQGSAVEFDDVELWPDPVDGADLLEEIVRAIRRYVVISEQGAIAVALWVIHTHALDVADISAILCISSPLKRCGKTTLQCSIRHLVARPLPASNISGAALFRTIEMHKPTMLLDEADSYLTDNEEMRNLLNAGVRRDDAYVYRVVGDNHEPRRFSVFGAKTVSLIGKLPGTLEDRSIVLRLERKKKTEKVDRLRARAAKQTFASLQQKVARWASDHLDDLQDLAPAIPESLNDRAADFWEPLLAIADLLGGSWPERARHAAIALSGDDSIPDDSASLLLLSDLRDTFTGLGEDRIASKSLAEALANLAERPWGTWGHGKPITPNQISRLLKPFGISPKTLRLVGDDRAKGYALEDCQDAFERYLPVSPEAEEGSEPL